MNFEKNRVKSFFSYASRVFIIIAGNSKECLRLTLYTTLNRHLSAQTFQLNDPFKRGSVIIGNPF